MITISQATREQLDELVPLVDGYRQFYRQPSDPDGVRHFMAQRFDKGDAHVLLALDEDNRAIGFAQLFPVPSTTSLATRWILNDLFVMPESRCEGAGSALLEAARDLARSQGVPQLMLRTQVENSVAKARYQALGWQRDTAFDTYLITA
ncbi:GNAT family N-acetyltransferase [Halomonas urumqiensis]|uniref:GNAT family N-acetyltransferase n=1 Tax=Halomonas urumqiensis TaxID=1684789 RepID=A0A2N7UD66_9GAMM|nr:GNAT family N-acetyltransferase [Halomonas urumqiensis]PMR78394.1 GNAT family N-acetyltransferase [Halomonas urumqiensis]PTB03540.1 N-acetyltransferase [Halomonas urumqiensis]GHE20260.1 putative N-acetyltransferase YhfO [Halomonas urumqiensis]